MREKWYLAQTVHQTVYDFLRLHCRTPENFKSFHREFFKKFPIFMRVEPALDAGLVQKGQMLHFLSEIGELSVGNQLARIYDALVYWDVFIELPYDGGTYDFRINFEMVDSLEKTGCLENVVKGPGFFIPRYFPATAAIIVKLNNGDETMGTGCVVAISDKTIILTNKHVLDPSKGRVETLFLGAAQHNISNPKISFAEIDDLAAFQIDIESSHPRFFLSDIGFILQEVILMGYPKIPQTTRPHLTVHSGEINAPITTRNGEELYLISNYAAPGSSGGPLIDYRGKLVGVVSDRLEGNYTELDGILTFQHSAAVTLERVKAFLDTHVKQTLV